jgi:hypothetical protein
MGLGSHILRCIYVGISAKYTCLGSAILHCTYVEISANHRGLGSAILPWSYVEISGNPKGFCSAIFPCSYVEIRDILMCLVSTTYVHRRMAEPKPIWLPLMSKHWPWRMAETNLYDYPWFLHTDKEESPSINPYDYSWFLHMDKE